MNEEDIAGNPVFNGFHWALSHEVDQAKREVKARTMGGFERRAVYRDGLGCLARHLVIARFGTTYDLRMAMIDICRLTADTMPPSSSHGMTRRGR